MTAPNVEDVNAFLIEAFPAAAATGIRCEELGSRCAVVRLPYDEAAVRPGGYISGPSMFTASDTALWFGCFTVIGIEAMAVTSELSIRFLRPARNGDLMARADIHSVGRRRIVGTIELWIDGSPDRPVAVAQGTYIRP